MRSTKVLVPWCIILFALVASFSGEARAQPTQVTFRYTSVDPSGACSNGTANRYNWTNNKEWGCENSVWTQVNSGGGGGGACPAGSVNAVQKTDGTNCAASSATDNGTTFAITEPLTAPSFTGTGSNPFINFPSNSGHVGAAGDLWNKGGALVFGPSASPVMTSLTTTGTGAATYSSLGVLNIPTPSGGGGSAGGASPSGWSGLPLTFVTNVTQYAPPVGGALTSTTESVVQLAASATGSISGLQVQVSAQLGVSATLAVTLRVAGVSSALTCTTASGGTTCSDTTHTISVTQGQLLDFLLVSGGTVTAGLPQIEIGYTGGVSGVTSLPPYLELGTTLYIPTDNMSTATLPNLTGYTVIGSSSPTVTTAANGDVLLATTAGSVLWYADPTHIASIESVLSYSTNTTGQSAVAGLFAYDSTNSRIQTCHSSPANGLVSYAYTYSGSGTPSFSGTNFSSSNVLQSSFHLKLAISGGTLTCSFSLNGGVSYATWLSQSIGTVAKIGYFTLGSINIKSAVVN